MLSNYVMMNRVDIVAFYMHWPHHSSCVFFFVGWAKNASPSSVKDKNQNVSQRGNASSGQEPPIDEENYTWKKWRPKNDGQHAISALVYIALHRGQVECIKCSEK